jgi:hypothetical protein
MSVDVFVMEQNDDHGYYEIGLQVHGIFALAVRPDQFKLWSEFDLFLQQR